jgi:hypothetical protein
MHMQKKLLAVAVGGALAAFAQTAQACWVRAPLELLFGAFLKGPLMTKTASDANQFAGRTTLSSGSATVVVSTKLVNSDSIINVSLLGNANLSSGTAIRGIEVKTISPGGYFTFGTQDGIAIPRDTVLMWELRRAS